jgi:hypothetical protein
MPSLERTSCGGDLAVASPRLSARKEALSLIWSGGNETTYFGEVYNFSLYCGIMIGVQVKFVCDHTIFRDST